MFLSQLTNCLPLHSLPAPQISPAVPTQRQLLTTRQGAELYLRSPTLFNLTPGEPASQRAKLTRPHAHILLALNASSYACHPAVCIPVLNWNPCFQEVSSGHLATSLACRPCPHSLHPYRRECDIRRGGRGCARVEANCHRVSVGRACTSPIVLYFRPPAP